MGVSTLTKALLAFKRELFKAQEALADLGYAHGSTGKGRGSDHPDYVDAYERGRADWHAEAQR